MIGLGLAEILLILAVLVFLIVPAVILYFIIKAASKNAILEVEREREKKE